MSAQRIAGRYAKSLIELAQEQGKLDAVTENIKHFQASVQNRDLQLLLASPIVSTPKKQAALSALFGNYDELTSAFIKIVTNKRREEALPAIADEYLAQYRAMKGISTVKLTSATPLEQSAVDAIKSKLVAQGLTTANIELEQEVDPELLGGFVLEVGDRFYDASAKAQLATLRKEFTGNPYEKAIR